MRGTNIKKWLQLCACTSTALFGACAFRITLWART